MEQGLIFQNNRSQAVRLPKAVVLPDGVKRVDIVAIGRARIIAPAGELWDKVKHIYFVAETKGSMSSMDLREIEKTKIKCARKFFDEMNRRFAPENVKYDVVNSFGKLMELVK